MSFMFRPLVYDDLNAVNNIKLEDVDKDAIIYGNEPLASEIANTVIKNNVHTVVIDGYVSAEFDKMSNLLHQQLITMVDRVSFIDMKDLYLPSTVLDEMLCKNLPPKSKEDPVTLFGKVFSGTITDLCDQEKVNEAIRTLKGITIIAGNGSATLFREVADMVIYLDVTPKIAAIRSRNGDYANIGDKIARPFSTLMRRNYFVDFEVVVKERKRLLQEDLIDYYICSDKEDWIAMKKDTFNHVLKSLSTYPFRCKPVYLEGIWGGEYIRKVRNLPKEYKNVAWIFEMIPMEVSVVIKIDESLLEFPFATLFMKYPDEIMGKQCHQRFDSYFPIRCNYDDTFHSDGNMSIQVHPNEQFVKENYNDKGSQDEAYYVVATGHKAKTYVGFNSKDGAKSFFDQAQESTRTGSDIAYGDYINHIESTPGRQIMLPAGTIHSSGQNQFILELGSLTIGSYTFKIYDYNRRDGAGNIRPIHMANAERVCDLERDRKWVEENIALAPQLIDEKEGYREYLLGKSELMYYETHRYEINTNALVTGQNNQQFTILTIVDGEKVNIYDRNNAEVSYQANYLDIIILPASIDEYVIENVGYQPAVIHKTILCK